MLSVKNINTKPSSYEWTGTIQVGGYELPVAGEYTVWFEDSSPSVEVISAFLDIPGLYLKLTSFLDLDDLALTLNGFDDGSWYEDHLGSMIDNAYDRMDD